MVKIALVFGGESSEHDVSIKSFLTIYDVIKNSDRLKEYLVDVFYINRDGSVLHTKTDYNLDTKEYYKEKQNYSIFTMFEKISKENLFLFSTIHGQYGEDGALQGAAKLFKIKSNLGTVLSTSLSMSKHHLNQYLKDKIEKLKIPESLLLSKDSTLDLGKFLNKNIIVKPNALGSSLFTEKFYCDNSSLEEIESLIENIFKFDQYALIQEFIEGDEFSCGCLEKKDGNLVLPVMEINSGDTFFSHKSKYQAGIAANTIIQENEENSTHKKIKDISLDIFRDLSFNSMARFDYIIQDNEIYFLEANILPGLKSTSIYPTMLRACNISMEELIVVLIENEIAKEQKETELKYNVS